MRLVSRPSSGGRDSSWSDHDPIASKIAHKEHFEHCQLRNFARQRAKLVVAEPVGVINRECFSFIFFPRVRPKKRIFSTGALKFSKRLRLDVNCSDAQRDGASADVRGGEIG